MNKPSHDPILTHLSHSREALVRASEDAGLLDASRKIGDAITSALRDGRKLLIAGNGGSAADAQHIAAEFVGRYKLERPAYAAIALTTDTSALTAVGNDYGFEQIFVRQVEGLGQRGDVLLAITTSGRSPNVLAALKVARQRGLVTVGFTGAKGTAMAAHCDHLVVAPSEDTAVIQQIHLTLAHGICDAVERALSGK